MDLSNLLASIYESPQDALRIAESIGLNTSHIATSGLSPVEFWYGTISQAKLDGKLAALVFAAYREYPNNDALAEQLNTLFKPSLVVPHISRHDEIITSLEKRLQDIELTLTRLSGASQGSLSSRTMTEAFIFALLIIVLVFALRG